MKRRKVKRRDMKRQGMLGAAFYLLINPFQAITLDVLDGDKTINKAVE